MLRRAPSIITLAFASCQLGTLLTSSGRVLAHAQASRDVVQDFVPLAESLEWELGQQSLRDRGNKALMSESTPVPLVINNDGSSLATPPRLFRVAFRS